MTKAHKCGNRTIRVDEIDAAVDNITIRMLGESERLVRDWDSGSDHSTELADIDAELVDRASLVGTPAFRQGTPQRAEWDRRIAALAPRQAEYDREQIRLDLVDVYQLTEQMDPSGSVAEWQQVLAGMADNDIQGMTIGPDGPVFTRSDQHRP
jgi:site-specific DNA recombinase